MKESREGIIRLEMFSESVMAATLEFIYTGHVQILTEDNARDLIVMADYLFLQNLKALAEDVLAQKLNISNCISTYHFSEKYQCEELICKSMKFILANFTAVYAAKPEDVLNMSNKEVEMWISSDEIDLSAEEDVFKIILAWIDHEKSNRRKYFAELFRHVRLVYVSRDFLSSDVVTNELVKENEDCLDLVKEAISLVDLIYSKHREAFPVSPRRSLESPAIVVFVYDDILCYFPCENNWCRLGKIPFEYRKWYNFYFSHEGKLNTCDIRSRSNILHFDPYSNIWMPSSLSKQESAGSPLEDKTIDQIFVGNEQEVYALGWYKRLVSGCSKCSRDDRSFISKYKPELNPWEDISIIDHDHFCPTERRCSCIVASDNFMYFIGGFTPDVPGSNRSYLKNVDRCDLSNGEWEKVADIQVARSDAHGAALNGKVYIVDGWTKKGRWVNECEMYNERTNEWQFIASLRKPNASNLFVADGKLYAVIVPGVFSRTLRVEFYNPKKDEWEVKSAVTVRTFVGTRHSACSMRLYRELSIIRPLETFVSKGTFSHKAGKQKCSIM